MKPTFLIERLVPFSADPLPKVGLLEKDYSVQISNLVQEAVPLRRCGRRVHKLSFTVSGAGSWDAVEDLDNWLDALGMF